MTSDFQPFNVVSILTQVSQSIVEGEDEESRVDRELSELSEQR